MEKSMSLAEMRVLCFDAVFRLLNQNLLKQNACTAVIRSECSYPAVVTDLQKKTTTWPVKAQNPHFLAQNVGLISRYDSKAPAVKVYSERVWGLKINQNLMFDTEKYSLQDLMIMALNIPMAKIYSDYAVNYYSNGKREYAPVKPISLVNQFRRPPLDGWKPVSLEQGYKLFPDALKDIYLRRSLRNSHILVDREARNFILSLDEASDVYVPFNCAIQGHQIRTDANIEMSGNLRSFFAAFIQAVRNGQYDLLTDDLRTFEQVTYHNHQPKRCKIKMMIGFADLPYQTALKLVRKEDLDELKRQAQNGVKKFSLSAKGELLDAKNIRTSFFFRDGGDEQIILAPQEVYERWGKDFPPQFLAKLSSQRQYNYCSGKNFMLNIAGTPILPRYSVELQRILALPAAGFAQIDGVDVAQLGQEILDGKLSVAEACQRYNKIAELVEEMIETTYFCEGAHYSGPERHFRLTGAYSGKVYQDRIIS